jgi:hypothetical protein
MTDVKCARCGKPAQGYATIANERYCHGDQERPTCYMRTLWEQAGVPTDVVAILLKEPSRWDRFVLWTADWVAKPTAPLARRLIGATGRWAIVVVVAAFVLWTAYGFLVPANLWWTVVRSAVSLYMGGLIGQIMWLTILLRRGQRQLQDLP